MLPAHGKHGTFACPYLLNFVTHVSSPIHDDWGRSSQCSVNASARRDYRTRPRPVRYTLLHSDARTL